VADLDTAVRLAAFHFLEEQTELKGEVLPRDLLAAGFTCEGVRVPLLGPQGIFKPAILDLPLSITTVPVIEGKARPYEDDLDENGRLRYRYRGTDPNHRDNAGLRVAMQRRVPLVYLFGIVPGRYMPAWPVYIVGDNPADLCFTVVIDEIVRGAGELTQPDRVAELTRTYATQLTVRRLHQETFRLRVLRAYRELCAICRLKHHELLEAAHILPDKHPLGEPAVSNGLALCKLHHAAFDRHFLGIRPDLIVEVRADILREIDGPMLVHGLQGFQNARIHVPSIEHLRPNREFLAERYEQFRKAG
jgi:putative restriction endonuclease